MSAIMFAWIVSFPVILLGKRGILGGIVSLSVFTIPFLYILSILVKNTAVFRIGTPVSVFTLIYMWVVYVLYTRFRQRKLLATFAFMFGDYAHNKGSIKY